MMPGLSGQAVYEQLVEIEPDVHDRVIFVTGGAFTPSAREFADRMGERVVKKPIEVADLIALVDRAARQTRA